jgi:transcriptional regulator with XRE-family HTH domain
MAYEHIKALLIERGESQADLAKLIGRTNAVVTNLFNGSRSLQIEEVEKLANHFNVSKHYILTGIEKEERNGPELRDSEIALMDTIKTLIQTMALLNPSIPDMLRSAFNYQKIQYEELGQHGAVLVMGELGKFVGEKAHSPERELIRRLLQLSPAGSA